MDKLDILNIETSGAISSSVNFQIKQSQKHGQFDQLIEANAAKDKFLSIIAHDLKSPFHALMGISEILTDNWEELSNQEKLQLINDIRNTSGNTFKLLDDLLKWAKSQKDKLEVCKEEIEIGEIVDSTLKIAENSAKLKQIDLVNSIDEKVQVFADGNMIATVFRNLITNAVKYTQPGGYINVSAFKESGNCTFCVADNGHGIDKPHILELFRYGKRQKLNDNAVDFKGLGLIICKDFVEKNGGQIWLETEKNNGSKFCFTLPC